ncbi:MULTISPECIES: class I SAM-dependent methyltransferase [unclassified Rhizobium]|uniref:class I SAM-dependent methyltransferase n=1 Tax=unclassified Rhizobium TaxID=2613769 RepID=UPI0037FCEF5E
MQRICADARELTNLFSEPVDYVLIANTFHGVPDQVGLVRSAKAVLRPQGLFGIVNWHALPREETTVPGLPRGPRTDMRMSPEAVSAVIEPEGFRTVRIIDLPPYHYGTVFSARTRGR